MSNKDYFQVFLAFFWAAVLLFSAGCSPKPQKKPAAPVPKVAVAASDLQWDGMQVMRKTMEERSKREGLEITWLDARNDFAEQKRQIEQLLQKTGAEKVKVVVIHPVDPAKSGPLVEALKRAGVKVIALERIIAGAPLDGYIASDHLLAGQLQVRYAFSQTGSSGPLNAVILRGDPQDPAGREIVAGISSALNERVRVVRELEHPRIDPAAAGRNLQDVLKESKVDVLFATDSRLAAGAAAALKSSGLQDRVLTIGVGADRTASRSLLAGDHDAEVDTMPDLMGQYVLDAAAGLARTGHWQYDARIANGNYSIPAKITPVRLIDRSNAYLLEQRWGKEEEKEKGRPSGGEEGKSGEGGSEGSGEGEGESEGKSGGAQGGGEEGEGGGRKTKLRITTQEGKTIEVDIPGEIKSIESSREEKKGGASPGGA